MLRGPSAHLSPGQVHHIRRRLDGALGQARDLVDASTVALRAQRPAHTEDRGDPQAPGRQTHAVTDPRASKPGDSTAGRGPLGNSAKLTAASPQQQFARLGGVARTLAVPLRARHLASTRPDPIITDPTAGALLSRLGLSHLGGDRSFRAVEVGTSVRTELLDDAVRRFAAGHVRPTVITLGAGLCTRCVRLADLDVTWVDLDLPPVAALRRSLLPPEITRTIVADSALNPGWRSDLAGTLATTPGSLLFILEGLTMYFTGDQVRDLVTDLADRFPGSHLLVETVGTRPHQGGKYPPGSRSRFTWGVRRMSELSQWHRDLELIDTWYLMDYHHTAWPLLIRIMRHLPSVRAQSKIGHFHVRSRINPGPM